MTLDDVIRERAHELYKADVNRTSPRELDDWLAAEHEILIQYDSVEAARLAWLHASWPHYLAFHEAQARHLPANFVDKLSGHALEPVDARWRHMNQIAFLSYSIFVNVALAKEAESDVTSPKDVFGTYDRTSRFFLRIGAAIDQSQHLEAICAKSWTQPNLSKGTLANPSLCSVLKKALDVVDRYNNFLKHNGLPATTLVESGGLVSLDIPTDLDKSKHKIWSDQATNGEVDTVLKTSFMAAMREFDRYYECLASATPDRLDRLGLKKKSSLDFVSVRNAPSGSFDGLDGYVRLP